MLNGSMTMSCVQRNIRCWNTQAAVNMTANGTVPEELLKELAATVRSYLL